MSSLDYLQQLKMLCREQDAPFFTDEELQFYYNKNNCNLNATVYECLILKSQNTTIQISGMTTADSSDYFRRLASLYRPNNSGVLK